MTSRICKVTSAVLFVIEFIRAIVLGNQNKTVSYDRYNGYQEHFNWGLFFGVVVVAFLFCLLLYALGDILEKLDEGNAYSARMVQLMERTTPGDSRSSSSGSGGYFERSHAVTPGTWTCTSCGAINPTTTTICRECGNSHGGKPKVSPNAGSATWKCAVCGKVNPSTTTICQECGAPKGTISHTAPGKWVCPQCKTENDESNRFCMRCGKAK